MLLSKWQSPSKWNLLSPVSLGDEQALSSHHVSVDSISTRIKVRVGGGGGGGRRSLQNSYIDEVSSR